jgi:protease-4
MYIAHVYIGGNITRRTVEDYAPVLNYIEKTRRAAGLILSINSPGGEASASEIIYNRIRKMQKTMPVFSVIEGMGTSGSYWIATASNRIYSMETSIIGSIGIINLTPNVLGLLEKLGVKVEVNKIGQYKDMLSPFKEVDEESRAKLMEVLGDIFLKFRNDVRDRRSIPEEEMEKIATGEIYSARAAKEKKLIDEIGDLDKAASDMSQKLGISKRLKYFPPRRPFLMRMFGSDFASRAIREAMDELRL